MNSLPYTKPSLHDTDMTTFLIYTFILSNSYIQNAYICQQGPRSLKPKAEKPRQRLEIQTFLVQGKL